MSRERIFYPEDPSKSPFKPYNGVLFRYDDPEFLKIEVDKRSTFLEFSTDKSPADAVTAYESIYGRRVRAQEVLNPNGEMDDINEETEIGIGPRMFLIVALKAYRYAWVEPYARFIDRDEPTPTIVINQLRGRYDERNTFLVSQLASPSVLADLDDTLGYIHSMRRR